MRSPASGLRPVVSVSKTISRIASLLRAAVRQTSEDAANRLSRFFQSAPGRDDEIGAGALLRVGHLMTDYPSQLRLAHPRPRQHPGPLHLGGRRDDRDPVDQLRTAFLEQQGNVEYDQRLAGMALQECLAFPRDRGMDQRLEPTQPGAVAEHRLGEAGPVDSLRPGRAREMRLDLL